MDRESIFKPAHKLNILIYFIILGMILCLGYTNYWNINMVYIMSTLFTILIISEILSQSKNFILKINNKLISYKDDKKIIKWENVTRFEAELGFFNNPSKIIIYTHENSETLLLKNYNKNNLAKVVIALNHHQENFRNNI